MTAGISTAIAGLKRAVIVALAAAAFVVPESSARASDIAALPDASLCNVILTTDRAAIDQSPHWSAHRAEATRRGLDLAACRVALGFPKDVPTMLFNLDDRTLCEGALNKEREGWEESPVWRQHRDEATRRALDVPACRGKLGFAEELPPPLAKLDDRVVCEGALDEDRKSWELSANWQRHRVEAARRGFDISACREALGLPATPTDALRASTDRSLCSLILNASRTGFDNSPTWAPSRAEAQRRKLDLAGCRVALGLPAELSDADRAAFATQTEAEDCSSALNAERTAFSNAPEAREARAALEKAGRTARDCRNRLDIRLQPLTAMIVAVEHGKQVWIHTLPVTVTRCFALIMRLDRSILRGKPLREALQPDEQTADLSAEQSQQLANASFLLASTFAQVGDVSQSPKDIEGRIRAVACVSADAQTLFSRVDARAVERQYSARIERLNATDVSLKGDLGLWQYPELLAEILASEAPRRLFINSNGGQTLFALLMSDVLAAADVELVVRKGANCHSSCAILAALVNGRAVVSRKADIGVHRIFDVRNGKPTHEGTEEWNRLLAEALRKAGVTEAFVRRMNEEASFNRVAPVREKDAITFGLQWRWTD